MMQFKLEYLEYQNTAIEAVIKVFESNAKNTFDNACSDAIRGNFCSLSGTQIGENIKKIAQNNGISDENLRFSPDNDLCVEMETGTGKTLVYAKTIYELHKAYAYTKFIILVPSIAIREGTLATFRAFEAQLFSIYNFKMNVFEYDSKKLQKVTNFIEDQEPQVMIMTVASFNSEDRILNQAQREDLFQNIPFIEAIAKTNPIIVMDEPQVGMDAEKSATQIARLKPLVKIRYSATHKIIKNLVYRLTPYNSYKQGLVKQIEVLTVAEKNDEATLKIEFGSVEFGKGEPKVKLKVWKEKAGKYVFEPTNWLQRGDNIGEKINNSAYLDYTIERIQKSLRTQQTSVKFTNGVEIIENQLPGRIQDVWALQIEWLLVRHFQKTNALAQHGIKCLSLIFIDKVANYMGENPLIKDIFIEKYTTVFADFNNGTLPTPEHIAAVQGYYFAENGKGEFADNEGGMKAQKKIYELILKKKNELLDINNPVQIIFSHSALGVGWDNPNIFNIATLNSAYSDIRKRQEIGRGLRICVNQAGERIYGNDINQLTVVPNDSYETFVAQYQQEIKDVYGTPNEGAKTTHSHKGKPKNEVKFNLNTEETVQQAFKRFWKAMARKTDYTVAFNEAALIENAIERINAYTTPDYAIEVSSQKIQSITEADGIQSSYEGAETYTLKGRFSPLDLIEEISENTGLSYNTVTKIVTQSDNWLQAVKNPPLFVQTATSIIRNVTLDQMLRSIAYHATDEVFDFDFNDFILNKDKNDYVDTPKKGVFDKMLVDSSIERKFMVGETDRLGRKTANGAEDDPEVVCFLKLPAYYKIKTPIGDYEPDFGIVMKRKSLKTDDESEFYFVVETKSTNDIHDKKAMTESEIYKIKCAQKHFKMLGVEVEYKAPIDSFEEFKRQI